MQYASEILKIASQIDHVIKIYYKFVFWNHKSQRTELGTYLFYLHNLNESYNC